MVCEGKVVLHSIQSASSLEVSRALLDGKAISCATPVLMHNSGLLPSGAGSHKQASFHPLLAVGTSAGIIFIVEPVSGTVGGRVNVEGCSGNAVRGWDPSASQCYQAFVRLTH